MYRLYTYYTHILKKKRKEIVNKPRPVVCNCWEAKCSYITKNSSLSLLNFMCLIMCSVVSTTGRRLIHRLQTLSDDLVWFSSLRSVRHEWCALCGSYIFRKCKERRNVQIRELFLYNLKMFINNLNQKIKQIWTHNRATKKNKLNEKCKLKNIQFWIKPKVNRRICERCCGVKQIELCAKIMQ